jgi:hypothetical protein
MIDRLPAEPSAVSGTSPDLAIVDWQGKPGEEASIGDRA